MDFVSYNGDYREGKLWIKGKGRMQRESVDLSAKSIAAIEDWLGVRGSVNSLDPLFVALDNKCFGMRLSGRSIDRILKRTAQKAQATTKVLSPHRIRHSSITAALDATNGDVRRVRKLSRHKKVETVIIYDENRLRDQGDLTDLISDLVWYLCNILNRLWSQNRDDCSLERLLLQVATVSLLVNTFPGERTFTAIRLDSFADISAL